MQETPVRFLGQEDPFRGEGNGNPRLPAPVFLAFPGGSEGKDSTCKEGDPSLIPG